MNNVTIYSTPTCVYCTMTKQYLTKKGVAYKDINVAEDEAAGREMVAKSGQMGVPVIDINGTILVGFQPKAFDALLEIKAA